MKLTIIAAIVASALFLAGCGERPYVYNGPEVTRILVYKESRKMYLMHHNRPLKVVDIDLGFAPEGHKEREGDGRTPVGDYYIDRRNPESAYHLSLGISYPNAEDMARAQAMGVSPGGDIFIHGQPNGKRVRSDDWTAGCIAVTNKEMRKIYAMVRTGTPISIYEE
jgi:murein L,D-transpeptidase YafK